MVERLVEVAARELGIDPAEFRRRNFITDVPAPDAGHHDLRRRRLSTPRSTRRWSSPTTRASASASARARRERQAARHRLLRLHRGLRHRAVAGGRLARRRRRPVGIGGGARQSDRHGRGAHRLAQPRPGPRDDLRAARVATGSASRSRRSRSCTATPTRCSSAWAPTARAPARSACRRSSRRSTRSIAKGKKVAALSCWKPPEDDIEFKDGKFTVAGTDKTLAFGEVALQAYIAHKFTGPELEPGLKEGAFYDPTNFTFPAGVHICEVEIDPETGDDARSTAGPRSTTSATSSTR